MENFLFSVIVSTVHAAAEGEGAGDAADRAPQIITATAAVLAITVNMH